MPPHVPAVRFMNFEGQPEAADLTNRIEQAREGRCRDCTDSPQGSFRNSCRYHMPCCPVLPEQDSRHLPAHTAALYAFRSPCSACTSTSSARKPIGTVRSTSWATQQARIAAGAGLPVPGCSALGGPGAFSGPGQRTAQAMHKARCPQASITNPLLHPALQPFSCCMQTASRRCGWMPRECTTLAPTSSLAAPRPGRGRGALPG